MQLVARCDQQRCAGAGRPGATAEGIGPLGGRVVATVAAGQRHRGGARVDATDLFGDGQGRVDARVAGEANDLVAVAGQLGVDVRAERGFATEDVDTSTVRQHLGHGGHRRVADRIVCRHQQRATAEQRGAGQGVDRHIVAGQDHEVGEHEGPRQGDALGHLDHGVGVRARQLQPCGVDQRPTQGGDVEHAVDVQPSPAVEDVVALRVQVPDAVLQRDLDVVDGALVAVVGQVRAGGRRLRGRGESTRDVRVEAEVEGGRAGHEGCGEAAAGDGSNPVELPQGRDVLRRRALVDAAGGDDVQTAAGRGVEGPFTGPVARADGQDAGVGRRVEHGVVVGTTVAGSGDDGHTLLQRVVDDLAERVDVDDAFVTALVVVGGVEALGVLGVGQDVVVVVVTTVAARGCQLVDGPHVGEARPFRAVVLAFAPRVGDGAEVGVVRRVHEAVAVVVDAVGALHRLGRLDQRGLRGLEVVGGVLAVVVGEVDHAVTVVVAVVRARRHLFGGAVGGVVARPLRPVLLVHAAGVLAVGGAVTVVVDAVVALGLQVAAAAIGGLGRPEGDVDDVGAVVDGPLDALGHDDVVDALVDVVDPDRHEADAPVDAGDADGVVARRPDEAGHGRAVGAPVGVAGRCGCTEGLVASGLRADEGTDGPAVVATLELEAVDGVEASHDPGTTSEEVEAGRVDAGVDHGHRHGSAATAGGGVTDRVPGARCGDLGVVPLHRIAVVVGDRLWFQVVADGGFRLQAAGLGDRELGDVGALDGAVALTDADEVVALGEPITPALGCLGVDDLDGPGEAGVGGEVTDGAGGHDAVDLVAVEALGLVEPGHGPRRGVPRGRSHGHDLQGTTGDVVLREDRDHEVRPRLGVTEDGGVLGLALLSGHVEAEGDAAGAEVGVAPLLAGVDEEGGLVEPAAVVGGLQDEHAAQVDPRGRLVAAATGIRHVVAGAEHAVGATTEQQLPAGLEAVVGQVGAVVALVVVLLGDRAGPLLLQRAVGRVAAGLAEVLRLHGLAGRSGAVGGTVAGGGELAALELLPVLGREGRPVDVELPRRPGLLDRSRERGVGGRVSRLGHGGRGKGCRKQPERQRPGHQCSFDGRQTHPTLHVKRLNS